MCYNVIKIRKGKVTKMTNFRIITNHDYNNPIYCETLTELWDKGLDLRNKYHFVELLERDKKSENVWHRVETYCDGNVHKWRW